MKLKKTILGLAVVAVAGVNAWLANDASAKNSVLSLLNVENVAEAGDCWYSESNSSGAVKYNCDYSTLDDCVIPAIGGGVQKCKGNKESQGASK